MTEKKSYSMLVYSNPAEGLEDEYLDWYAGQHIHDLLKIPGYKSCKFFRLAETQLNNQQHPFKYMIIWNFETDDLQSVMNEIKSRMKDGRTVFIPAFDTNYEDSTWEPITKYVETDEIEGKSPEDVLKISELHSYL